MSLSTFSMSGLVLSGTCIVLLIILLRFGRTTLHKVWALFNISLIAWGVGVFYIGGELDKETAVYWWKVAHFGIIFIPIFFFNVIYLLCDLKQKIYLVLIYLQGAIFLVLNIFSFEGIFISDMRIAFDSFYYFVPGYIYNLFFALWLLIVSCGVLVLFVTYRKSIGIKKNQIAYFLGGISIGFSGGLTNFLPVYNIDIYPVGNFAIPIYCIMATYAVLRYRLMDINLVFRKSMAYSLSAGIMTSLFVVIVISMTKFLTDMAGVESYTILAVTSLVIAILFNPLRNRIQRLVDKIFYKKSYDYYSTIKHVSSSLASTFNRKSIFKFVGDTEYEVLGLKGVYVLAAVPAEGSYEVVYYISKDGGSSVNALTKNRGKLNLEENSEVIKLFAKSKDIIVKDEFPLLEEKFGRDVVEEIEKDMEKFKGEVLIPVFLDGKLSFLMVLEEKMSGDAFTVEDMNMLSTISDQMAISLKNAQLYAGRVQTERLASIGMMSATFAHEIRNPMTSLKTFAQLMPEKYNDQEFRDTFSKIVVGEIEKIDTLIGDLLDFSTEKKAVRINNFNIVELVDETLDYIKGKVGSQKEDIDVVRLYHENVIDMSGDATKLKQAFGIIITNGYQAMNGNGKLTIDIKKNTESIDVAITDTGEGITHEDISRIFDPFVTTKEMGVGLGLAITKRIIEDHEGKIHVRSKLTEGTTFTISLPVKN